tara:strand:+ start:705 stop:1946 length:1242 start_codon:yes stop_codon:yes gene_type:complete
MGLISILIVTLVVVFLARRWPSAAPILYVALAVRAFVIVMGNNFITLPDTTGDAYWFEIQAYEWSLLGFPDVLYSFEGFDPTFEKDVSMSAFKSSFFVSYIIAILYSLSERSVMMAQSISLLFGTLSVLMSWTLAQKLWDNRTAMKVGWFVALFPSLILYSALVMREIYVCFFLLVALNYVVDWSRTGSLKSFFLVILNFMIGMVFHGGVIVGLIVFLVIFSLKHIKELFKKILNGFILYKPFIGFALIATFIAYNGVSNIYIPKIGTITNFDKLKKNILYKNIVTHRGDAKYPDWIIAKSANELIYKMPIKAMYFIFSPFPWDVKKSSHLIGMFDGFLHIFLVYLIFLNRKIIWADPALRIIFLMLLAYLVIYGVAIGNFGTGIRHRTKFIAMFILLAAPLLPKFTFSRKKK